MSKMGLNGSKIEKWHFLHFYLYKWKIFKNELRKMKEKNKD